MSTNELIKKSKEKYGDKYSYSEVKHVNKKTADEFIHNARKIHGDKYNYIKKQSM